MPEYQERLKRKNERCNAETIPRVNKIPRANHITRHVDGITSEQFFSVFNTELQTAQQYGALDQYQVLGRYHLAALDGVWFYQPGNIHCEHCLHQKQAEGNCCISMTWQRRWW
jgi:hypothetical protein